MDGSEPRSKPGSRQSSKILADAGVVAGRPRDGHESITIILTEVADRPGYFSAHTARGDLVVARSRTPFCDAARALIDDGFDPATKLVMTHAGSAIECLQAPIGAGALLTVEESAHGPVFRRHRTGSSSAVEAPRVRSGDRADQ
jgi:hypothetical protein